MADLVRLIMRDTNEESLDDLFDELTADDKRSVLPPGRVIVPDERRRTASVGIARPLGHEERARHPATGLHRPELAQPDMLIVGRLGEQ